MTKRVLLVEDNEQNRYLMTYLLDRLGHEVVTATDGPGGLVAARSILPDLILLDVQLPGLDGHAVARELRRDTRLARTPIVAVTSYAMPGDREAALAAGCDGYLEKPFEPEAFMAAVEQALADGGRRGGG